MTAACYFDLIRYGKNGEGWFIDNVPNRTPLAWKYAKLCHKFYSMIDEPLNTKVNP
jgi:hypothetical protein